MPGDPKISIIIPAFNSQDTLADCLNAIFLSNFQDFEVIVVDDSSKDSTLKIAENFPVEVIKHDKNQGAAISRNDGAEKAKSDILLFIDSDVFIKKDTLEEIWGFFNARENIAAVACTMSGKYCAETFGSKFITLRTCYYYRWKKYEIFRNYTIFQSQCGAIKKEVFQQLGGFDPRFQGVGIEEYEFGHRLSNAYKNVLLRNVQFDRKCKNFKQRLRALLTRSSIWAPIFLKRMKFESAGAVATPLEGLSTSLSFFGTCCFLLFFIHYNFLIFSFCVLLIQLLLEIKFLQYVYLKTGLFFVWRAYFAIHLMNLAISIGFIHGALKMVLESLLKRLH